jgi:hypothetical protein
MGYGFFRQDHRIYRIVFDRITGYFRINILDDSGQFCEPIPWKIDCTT